MRSEGLRSALRGLRRPLITLTICVTLAACNKAESDFCKSVPDKGDYLDVSATGSPPSESAAPDCRVRSPAACQTESELVWAPDFEPAVNAFAGKALTTVYGAGPAPLSDIIFRTLRGPPDDPIRVADGSFLFTACAAHNCTEKGAIVISASGSITMAATLTNHLVNEDDVDTLSGPHFARLDIFVVAPSPAASAWRRPIRTWAKAAYEETHAHFEAIFETHSIGLTEHEWRVSPRRGALTEIHHCMIV